MDAGYLVVWIISIRHCTYLLRCFDSKLFLDSRFVYLSAGYESNCKAGTGTESTEFNCSVIDHQPRSQCALGMNVPEALHKISVSGLASPSTRLSASRLTELIIRNNKLRSIAATAATASPDHLISARVDRSIHTEYTH
ncbi:hypothetical protein GB937_007994 [Aspergillus fischeri]|nr:hypothetical protein GB937_007994 [Aspergillus fischeri]